MKWFVTVAAALLAAAAPASAEVRSSGPNGFEVEHSISMVVPPQSTFDAFMRIAEWWSPAHTYSGKSSNLSLSLSPGGCFCEQLDGGGGIEHLRVVQVQPGEKVVLTGGLGPLLHEATAGVMSVTVERVAGGSRLVLNYRVAGFANGGAARLAPLVDKMLGDQLVRLRKYAAAKPRGR
jgi:uncharacterized protein YndB with AHSA1/START domain